MLTDDDLDRLVERFIVTAKLAWDAGYAFVDVKHCHGYLGHQLLSAQQRRDGTADRSRIARFLRSIVEASAPRFQVSASCAALTRSTWCRSRR